MPIDDPDYKTIVEKALHELHLMKDRSCIDYGRLKWILEGREN